jgi:CRP/FNR family transcriptional regulator, dissimilatory nitrate respiration regulator
MSPSSLPANREAALAALRRHYLFAAFSPEEIARIEPGVALIRRAEESMLFERGDPAAAFYVVLDGEVRLFLRSREGGERVLQSLHSGQSFAEAVMFVQMPVYPVAARLSAGGAVAAIRSDAYLEVLRQNSAACLRLLGDLSARLHGLVAEIESLTFESAKGRVVRQLLSLAARAPDGSASLQLDEPKQSLAARLAITPETLSRVLRALSDEGLIAMDGRRIDIASVTRLHGLVGDIAAGHT